MSFLQIVSGCCRHSGYFSANPAGMNAIAESDLRNYYDRLQAMQTVEMTAAMMGSASASFAVSWARVTRTSLRVGAALGHVGEGEGRRFQDEG